MAKKFSVEFQVLFFAKKSWNNVKWIREVNANLSLKYKYITYGCYKAAPKTSRSTGKRKRPSMKTDCPWRLRVVLQDKGESCGQELVIREVKNDHNHAVIPAAIARHPKKRKLDEIAEAIQDESMSRVESPQPSSPLASQVAEAIQDESMSRVESQQPSSPLASQDISDQVLQLKMPPPSKPRGRPKNLSRPTAIGLPRRSRACQPFSKKAVVEKEEMLLSWIIDEADLRTRARSKRYIIKESDVPQQPELVNNAIIDPLVKPCLPLIRRMFDCDAWACVEQVVAVKQRLLLQDKLPHFCGTCKCETCSTHVQCESCMQWFHEHEYSA
ncbi:hypothetical protein CAPTEDRAFT_210741 [Capitella teleta]|uniref:FAR1 domain-containing protein n=1 Tax=Capitella teleta TaxID=283909 RepID=R7UVA1_CAPTE|nr:hypothetical protein CAPTEDRAFT_210741 [Capitella teleta]|eukprot:ELU07892.1 hypothetical protein CAPTEDRAFT_210741 [Capitella teleta]